MHRPWNGHCHDFGAPLIAARRKSKADPGLQRVFLSMGTNLGDRQQNLENALAALSPSVRVRAISPVYETTPWGVTEQPDFLNLVVEAETGLPPQELLKLLKGIETKLGRVPSYRFGPRLIDIDILFYGDRVIEVPGLLSIPHLRLAERAFVLVPLAQLAPELRHPVTGQSVRELLAGTETKGMRKVGRLLINRGSKTRTSRG